MNKYYISSALLWLMIGLVISCFIQEETERVIAASATWCIWFASWIYAYKLSNIKEKENDSNKRDDISNQ